MQAVELYKNTPFFIPFILTNSLQK